MHHLGDLLADLGGYACPDHQLRDHLAHQVALLPTKLFEYSEILRDKLLELVSDQAVHYLLLAQVCIASTIGHVHHSIWINIAKRLPILALIFLGF